jgi:hypothetical protein
LSNSNRNGNFLLQFNILPTKHSSMKQILFSSAVIGAFTLAIASCQKEAVQAPESQEVSAEALQKIYNLGFTNKEVTKDGADYIVEGDIRLSEADLDNKTPVQLLRAGNEEQYRTTLLVTGTRTISFGMSSKLPSSYRAALDEVVARYNALGLKLTFVHDGTATSGTITFVPANGSYLASAGFPTAGGDPHNQVKVNARAIGNQPLGTVASILAHEVGHCIGFRHTDYYDRSISCGGSPSNEGASTVGAILIPGTPATATNAAQSWMLACIGSGQNRPFNNDDKTALTYLYK